MWRTLYQNLYGNENENYHTLKTPGPSTSLTSLSPPPVVSTGGHDKGVFDIERNGSRWRLETKITLSELELESISGLACLYAPPGSTVSLQADMHIAGRDDSVVFVGTIMSFDHQRIPISLVSADIGCGLSIIPVVRDGKHVRESELSLGDARKFHLHALMCMRTSLKRGKVAEQGLSECTFLSEAAAFYAQDLDEWLNELDYVIQCTGLQKGKKSTLEYVSTFSQSLGSSGNHFCELTTDNDGFYWLVVHSGSRALGAKVYDTVATLSRHVNSGLEVATGPLALFYTRAYDALNKFAKFNRIVCAIAVLDALKCETSADVLKKVMMDSPVFAPAIDKCSSTDQPAMLALLGGLTHNGIKAYVNPNEKQVLYVLSKGAVSMCKRASASIVALRAGEGSIVWTMADGSKQWREVSLGEAIALNYTPVYSSSEVVYSGHGAGRSRSTTKTASLSTFGDIVDFFKEHDVVGNIAPGVLGDNPSSAYKPLEAVIAALPTESACTLTYLRTRVSYKEGLSFKGPETKSCAEFIEANWDVENDDILQYDLNASARFLSRHQEMVEEQNKVWENNSYLKPFNSIDTM